MNDIERQLKIEADAVQDGIDRYAEIREFQSATDSKTARHLIANAPPGRYRSDDDLMAFLNGL